MQSGFDGSLNFSTEMDTDGFTKGINSIQREATTLKGVLGSLAKYAGAAFAGVGLVSLGKKAIDTASDLQEAQNVVDTAFGSMSSKMEKFAETSIETYGMSKLVAKQTGSTYMSMAKGMDIASDSASDMSIALTGLTGDWASFYNRSVDETSTALKGIFTGETESLKTFGYVMTEANLNAYALEKGLGKTTAQMTQQEKVMLRYNYIMEKSAMTQGDFAKTSDSWANQTRVLKERFNELLTTLGNGLIQVLVPSLRIVNNLLSGLINVANTVGGLLNDIFGIESKTYSATASAGSSAESAASGVSSLGDAVEETADKIDGATASFDTLEKLGSSSSAASTQDLSSALDIVGSASDSIGSINSIKKATDEASEGMDGLSTAVTVAAGAIATAKLAPKIAAIANGLLALGPTGAIIVGVGAGLGLLAGYLWQCWEDTKEADLESRFGDIELSADELNDAAREIVGEGALEDMANVLAEWGDLEGLSDQVKGAVDTINKLNWKINIGMELTEAEQGQYKEAISTYVNNVQEYAKEQEEAVLISLDVLLSDGSAKDSLIQSTQEFYSGVNSELTQLGKDLNQAVQDGWEDGFLDIDEQAEIARIQGEMQTIYASIAASNYNAELGMLQVKFTGADLSPETFQALEKQISATAQGYMDDYDTALKYVISSLSVQLEQGNITTEEYDAAIADLKANRLENIGTVTLNATRFVVTGIVDAFTEEIGQSVPQMHNSMQNTIDTLFNTEDFYTLPNFWSAIELKFNQGYDELEGVAASNVSDLLELMSPTKEQLIKLANEAKANGEVVPKNVAEGLVAISQLEAMSGNVDALYLLIGSSIADSPEKIAMLEKAKAEGQYIPDAVWDGIELGKQKPAESVQELFDMIGVTAEEASAILDPLMKSKGESALDQFKAGLITGKEAALQIVRDMYDELSKMKVPTITAAGINLAVGGSGNYQIPAYAKGNVIPANYGNFMAMLGDSKEPEYVAPESAMKQSFLEALKESGYSQNKTGNSTVILQVEGREIGRASYQYGAQEQRRVGTTFIKGGDFNG